MALHHLHELYIRTMYQNLMSAPAMQGGHNEMSLQWTEIERLDACVVLK